MEKTWSILIAILLFLILTYVYWLMTSGFVKKVHGKTVWRQWGTRMFYWTGALFMSGGATVLVILFLKWANLLTF
jgi:hypothetical protein